MGTIKVCCMPSTAHGQVYGETTPSHLDEYNDYVMDCHTPADNEIKNHHNCTSYMSRCTAYDVNHFNVFSSYWHQVCQAVPCVLSSVFLYIYF